MAVTQWVQLGGRGTADCCRHRRDSVVGAPFPQGKGNTGALQPSPRARHYRPLPICQKPDADGCLSPFLWDRLRHPVDLARRLLHAALYLGSRMGTQGDRGARVGEAAWGRLSRLSEANSHVHTEVAAPKVSNVSNNSMKRDSLRSLLMHAVRHLGKITKVSSNGESRSREVSELSANWSSAIRWHWLVEEVGSGRLG